MGLLIPRQALWLDLHPHDGRLCVSVANCRLIAGLNPPSPSSSPRASASVVLTRSCRSRICCPRCPGPPAAPPPPASVQLRHCAIACSAVSPSLGPRAGVTPSAWPTRPCSSASRFAAAVLPRAPWPFPATPATGFPAENCRPGTHPVPHSVLAHPLTRTTSLSTNEAITCVNSWSRASP